MLEQCPFCEAKVLFTGSICPNCQIDRANPDPQKVAERNRLEESVAKSAWWHNTFNIGMLSLLLAIFGVVITLPEYSFRKSAATAVARVTGQTVERLTRHGTFYDFPYEFEVKGRTYRGYARRERQVVATLQIYYDKDKPWKNKPNPDGLELGITCMVVGLLGVLVFCIPWYRLLFTKHRQQR